MRIHRPEGFGPLQGPPAVRLRRQEQRPLWLRIVGRLALFVLCGSFIVAFLVDGFSEVSEAHRGPVGRYARTLATGDCFDRKSGVFGFNHSVAKADCADPHDGEAFGVWFAQPGASDEYPGRDALVAVAREQCRRQAVQYAGDGWKERHAVRIVRGTVPEEAWSDGVRFGRCFFLAEDGEITGSLRSGGTSEAV